MPGRHETVACSIALLAAAAAPASGQVTREEALALVYPQASVKAEQIFLTAVQQARLSQEGIDVGSSLVARYLATLNGVIVGRAYVDTHVVRTKRESLLISLDASGRVKRIDVTAFLEPTEYQASESWLRQYQNRGLSDDLQVNRAIRPMAGATLTIRAVNAAVRRVLAIDALLAGGTK
jgi:hypothetical protein